MPALRGVLAAAALLSAPALRAQPPQGAWAEISDPMSTARSEMRGALIDSLVYVPGGFISPTARTPALEAFNPATGKWKRLRDLPQLLDHHMVEAYRGRLYVFKGTACWVYDPAADQWQEQAGARLSREDGTAVTLGDHIYLIGGQGVRAIERYSPETRQSTALAAMRVNRGHCQAVAQGGRLYVLGGRDGHTPLRSIEVYDPTANAWTDGPPMRDARGGFAAAALGGRIVVAGGEANLSGGPVMVPTCEIFSPDAGTWTPLPEMPAPVHGAASAAFGGKLLVMGGSHRAYGAVVTGKVFQLELAPVSGAVMRVRPGPAAGEGARRRADGRLSRMADVMVFFAAPALGRGR